MDNRKIKLALTVKILNSGFKSNLTEGIKEVMLGFKEVGAFIGNKIIRTSKINGILKKETHNLQFENCAIDVDLVLDEKNNQQFVQQFDIRK